MATIADFKSANGLWVKTVGVGNGASDKTKSYSLYYSISYRCDPVGKFQKRWPTYVGCLMSPMFNDFQRFVDWCHAQVGYDQKGWHLDKDILKFGNRQYSEELCVFVPTQLNSFFCAANRIRGDLPQGVSRAHSGKYGTFQAQLYIDGKCNPIGSYSCVEEAHAAYKAAKEAEAYRWYERLRDGEFIVDPRVIERMRTWTLPDIDSSIEV